MNRDDIQTYIWVREDDGAIMWESVLGRHLSPQMLKRVLALVEDHATDTRIDWPSVWKDYDKREATLGNKCSQDAATLVLEDGQRVYPCWCGETHRGAWAAETWSHHNCLHREPLVTLGPAQELGTIQTVCGLCGKVFIVDTRVKP